MTIKDYLIEKREFVLNCCFVILLFISFFCMYQYYEIQMKLDNITIKAQCDIRDYQRLKINETPRVNGVYWIGRDFYCVMADERTLSEQESTDRHEYCHYLVDNDYNHFCIKYKELKGN
jgi:hypothetical protein